MGQYKANGANAKNFNLVFEHQIVGELVYKKWYSFSAEIRLATGMIYTLEPKGFWESSIELSDGTNTLLRFEMGWKGIVIHTLFDNKETTYLLTLKGLLSSKFILLNTDKEALMVAEADFKWSRLHFDYHIETTEMFDSFDNKELLLLTVLHCINYYITVISASA